MKLTFNNIEVQELIMNKFIIKLILKNLNYCFLVTYNYFTSIILKSNKYIKEAYNNFKCIVFYNYSFTTI